MSTTYKRIAAVDLSCRLLEHLANQRTPVTGQDVARALDLPIGTVMCHLSTLEDRNFVRRIGDTWSLGMALALFWARVKSSIEATRDRAERDLQSLHIEQE